ncbi:MAG: DUF3276 family protein [Cytophagales bacterium]|nr:PUR family DNA/RNA-binding protein [Bernardetiaceae bacterium]MDW8211132.1 DUF3276 family protein [Cytophagales bacterium]
MEEFKESGEIYSQRIRAGKRTYFFDIRSTRGNDYYITITESKRRLTPNGFVFDKHKIFLYKEDFFKFTEALNQAIERIKNDLMPDVDFSQFEHNEVEESFDGFPEEGLKWD